MNTPINSGADVALFLDWENFKISLAVGHRHPNVSALKEEVSNYGRVVVAKAYADWVTRAPELRGASQFINDPPALYAAGIDPVYVPTRLAHSGASPGRTTRVKNSVDVKMTADCIECAHSYPNIGTYVLVSGDSDFIHVINALRTMGKRVVIIGVSWATSRRFADQVDELILYDVDVDVVSAPEPQPASNGHNSGRAAAARQELSAIIAAIEDIVRTERQAGGTPLLTSIKQRLMRRHPNFDEKKFGFSGFKKLMSRVAQEGNIKVVTAGLVDWAIMADEEHPEESDGVSADGGQDAAADVVETPHQARRRRFQGTPVIETSNEAIADSTGDGAEENVPGQPAESAATAVLEENALEQVAEPDAPGATVEHLEDQPAEPTPTPEAEEPTEDTGEIDSELVALLEETVTQLNLPAQPEDDLNGARVSDLIVMADTLERQQEGNRHMAFNFLVAEVCQALNQGVQEEHPEIMHRWGQAHSRSYVSKIVRELGNANLFVKGWHNVRDEESGRRRRLSTFNLNREHALVAKVLRGRW